MQLGVIILHIALFALRQHVHLTKIEVLGQTRVGYVRPAQAGQSVWAEQSMSSQSVAVKLGVYTAASIPRSNRNPMAASKMLLQWVVSTRPRTNWQWRTRQSQYIYSSRLQLLLIVGLSALTT